MVIFNVSFFLTIQKIYLLNMFDVTGETNLRVINVYRTFATQAGESQQSKFKYQLSILRKATDVKFIMLGDFNLDYSMKNDVN